MSDAAPLHQRPTTWKTSVRSQQTCVRISLTSRRSPAAQLMYPQINPAFPHSLSFSPSYSSFRNFQDYQSAPFFLVLIESLLTKNNNIFCKYNFSLNHFEPASHARLLVLLVYPNFLKGRNLLSVLLLINRYSDIMHFILRASSLIFLKKTKQ